MTPPTPPPAIRRSVPSAQAALAAFLVCVIGILAYRTYSPRLTAHPTEEILSIASAARPIDLNTAERIELLQLPGVGPNLADAILNHRTANGRFDGVDDLTSVPGVGSKTLDKIRPFVRVTETVETLSRKPRVEPPLVPSHSKKVQPGERPIDVNRASEAELMRLPRVGPVLAAAIVTARAEKPFAHVDDLRRVRGIGVKTLDALRPFVTVSE